MPLQHVGAVERAVVDVDEELVGPGHRRRRRPATRSTSGPPYAVEHDGAHQAVASLGSASAAASAATKTRSR